MARNNRKSISDTETETEDKIYLRTCVHVHSFPLPNKPRKVCSLCFPYLSLCVCVFKFQFIMAVSLFNNGVFDRVSAPARKHTHTRFTPCMPMCNRSVLSRTATSTDVIHCCMGCLRHETALDCKWLTTVNSECWNGHKASKSNVIKEPGNSLSIFFGIIRKITAGFCERLCG